MDYLDLNTSTDPQYLDTKIDDERAWLGTDIDPARCLLQLDARCLDEIRALVTYLRENPLPALLRKPEHFSLPTLAGVMAKTRELLDRVGVVVIDALPLQDMAQDDAKTVFWVLGQLVGRPVSQKWDGTMLYDVRDTGQPWGYGVRGSYTNIELVFHNDNAFGAAVPHYVALLCLQTAKEGGISRFCSLYSVHNRMLERFPEQLKRLYQPLLWDRQAEHCEGKPKVARGPAFVFDGERLSARINVSLIRKGYAVAGEAIDDETEAALEALATVAGDSSLWFELPLQNGNIQYLNNRETAHYRSEYKDHDDPKLKRHLIRMWHRDEGAPTYDG